MLSHLTTGGPGPHGPGPPLRGKRFAWLLVDHHGDGRLALWVKAPPGEQDALVSSDARRLDDASRPDWAEIGGLLEQAWRMAAMKTAVAAYDATRARPG